MRRERLACGLVVIARRDAAARSVTARLVLPAGAACDPPDRSGTALLTARLLDRGAAGRTAESIAADFESQGIVCTTSATRDSIELAAHALPERLEAVLERLRWLAVEPEFPQAEVERHKAHHLTRLTEREQDTFAVAQDVLFGTLYPEGHPYHSPIEGERDSVARLGRSDFVEFHRRACGPAGSVLVLAGALDPDRALDRVRATFSGWRPAAATAPAIPAAPLPRRPRALVRPIRGKTQSDIALGILPGVSRSSPGLHAALLLNAVVGDIGFGGRLARALRERAGLAYYAYAALHAWRGAGPWVACTGVASDQAARAVRLMTETLDGVVRRGVTPREVADARLYLSSALPRRFETCDGTAAFLAECEFYGLGIDYPDRLPGLIAGVSRDEIQAAIGTCLDIRGRVVVVAGSSAVSSRDLL